MKHFFNMWATLALAIVLAWGASYFAPVASAAGKLELTDAEKSWLAEHKTMRLGVDPSYPPFEFVGEDGTYSGLVSDYARLVGERLGVTLKVVPGLSWSQVIEGVKSGTVDVLPAVTKTPDRSEYMNFSREHLNFPDVILMRDNHSLVAGLSDMKGRKVALVDGYSTVLPIRTKYPTVRILIVETPLHALKAVAEGEADATVQNLGVATYLIKKHDLTNLVVAAPAGLNQPGLSFGVRKDWPELVPIIDKALASITPAEEAAIRENWGSTQYQIGINIATVRRVALQAGGAGAVIVIFMVLWNRRLSREVKQRKRAEEALAEKEAQLRVALDNIPGGMALGDRDLNYVLFNSQYSELYGFPDGLIEVGGSFRDVVLYQADRGDYGPGDKDDLVEEAVARYQRSEAVSYERAIAGSGQTLQISISPTPEGGYVSIVTDITERKRAEEALLEAKQRSEEASKLVAEKNRMLESLSNQLSKYLSPQVYASIFSGEQSVEIASKRKKLTVFFSDIADFTGTTDSLESEELTNLLNHYLTEMSKIALDHGATIDKYVGDSIIAFFGDPETKGVKEDANACVKMAIAMQRRMHGLQSEWLDMGLERPFQQRIGINTGFCTVGNFGSEDRMDYTIIGNEVNLAARLEALAEGGGILMAHETHSLVKDTVMAEEGDTLTVKGFAKPVRTYSIVGLYDGLVEQGRIIHKEQDGVRVLVDLKKGDKADAIQTLEDVLSQLKG